MVQTSGETNNPTDTSPALDAEAPTSPSHACGSALRAARTQSNQVIENIKLTNSQLKSASFRSDSSSCADFDDGVQIAPQDDKQQPGRTNSFTKQQVKEEAQKRLIDRLRSRANSNGSSSNSSSDSAGDNKKTTQGSQTQEALRLQRLEQEQAKRQQTDKQKTKRRAEIYALNAIMRVIQQNKLNKLMQDKAAGHLHNSTPSTHSSISEAPTISQPQSSPQVVAALTVALTSV